MIHDLLRASVALLVVSTATLPACDPDDDSAHSTDTGATGDGSAEDNDEDGEGSYDGAAPTDDTADGGTHGTDNDDGDPQDGADVEPVHPLCEACVARDERGPSYVCEPGLDCGVFYVTDGLHPVPGCEAELPEDPEKPWDDSYDCSDAEPLNQAVVDCVIEAAASGTAFAAQRREYELFAQYDRRFHIEGGLALDVIVDRVDALLQWPEVRVLEAPDVSACAGLETAADGWACIEAAFDATGFTTTCYSAGSFAK